jgi:hypothetical protein
MPPGTVSLLLGCAPAGEPQFSGIRRLLGLLGVQSGAFFQEWDGERLSLGRRRGLRRILICGHGSEQEAGFSSPEPASRPRLTPALLRIPGGCRLFLIGCHQGRESLRRAWALGTGAAPEAVLGSEGETESALSTCLLLHLLEDGLQAVDRWFPHWIRCNAALRPLFPRIRSLYGEHDGDPLQVLSILRTDRSVQEQWEFLEVIEKYPQYLSGLT